MTKKAKKIEKKVEQTAKGTKASELSEQELEKAAGGGTNLVNISRSNIKNN